MAEHTRDEARDEGPDESRGPISRRQALRRLGAAGVAMAAAPAVLAACGDDSSSSATTAAGAETTTTKADATTTTAAGGAATTVGGGGTAGPATPADLPKLLGLDTANLGGGTTFKLASVLALSGPGSFYGKTMTRGIDLAVEHIKTAGGPDIQVKYWDHKSGDPQAGVVAVTEIGSQGYPAKLASYTDDIGAMFDGTKKYKIFTLDGGGGTSVFGQGLPYFWGTRALPGTDPMPGIMKYVKETTPTAKTCGIVVWDIGSPYNETVKDDVLAKIKGAGFEHNGLYELVPVGGQDFAQVLPKIKANEPDLIILGIYGQDIGSYINQSTSAGVKAVQFGVEFTPDGINASKGAFEKGYLFGYDYFDAGNPVSPLGKLFVESFQKKYGELPDFYAANFYENSLVMWNCISRVLKKGGDINSGEQLDAALQENLTLPSVYGGDASTVGTFTLDPKTHTVIKREMGIFEYKAGKVTPLAFFDIGGENFRMV